MNLYALAMRPDSDELRDLGRQFLEVAKGDPALVVGWLLNDWMALCSGESLDKPQDDLLDSRVPGRWRELQ